jgi:hypothetical protein
MWSPSCSFVPPSSISPGDGPRSQSISVTQGFFSPMAISAACEVTPPSFEI